MQTAPEIAKVDQVEGLYIFIASKPVNGFNYLGTIKKGGFLTTPSEMLPGLIKEAKKKHPETQGLLIDINFEKADCISFK